MELANQGDMHSYLLKLKTSAERIDACGDCLRQLLPVLAYLKHPSLGFQHNDCKIKNIFVHVTEKGEVIYRLADFDKSSISWRKIRFYNKGPKGLDYVVKNTVVYNETGQATLSCNAGLEFLCNKNTSVIGPSIAQHTMYNASGYYLSYDIYTLVTSMLFFDKTMYDDFQKYPYTHFFRRVVSRMNTPRYLETVDKYIQKYNPQAGEPLRENARDLQSLTIINGLLHKNNIIIRNDIDQLMQDLDLQLTVPPPDQVPVVQARFSKNGHFCLTKPYTEAKQLRCKTPQYISWTGVYNYDVV